MVDSSIVFIVHIVVRGNITLEIKSEREKKGRISRRRVLEGQKEMIRKSFSHEISFLNEAELVALDYWIFSFGNSHRDMENRLEFSLLVLVIFYPERTRRMYLCNCACLERFRSHLSFFF